MSSEAKNLEAISKAIDQHNANCPLGPAAAVLMNPYEAERLDWDEIRGVPIKADERIGTGRFRIVCAGQKPDGEKAEAEVEKRVPAPGELVPA